MRYRGRISDYQQAKLDRAFARADREAALRKQNGRCEYCLCELSYKTATRDHVRPRSDGGSDGRNNIVAACNRCNQLKGAMPVKKFTRMVRFPERGEPIAFRLAWMDRRINAALMRMKKNLERYAR